MKLLINGETKDIDCASLGEWASAEFACPAKNIKGIALAINDKVIPKSKWDECPLQSGDRILAISAAQGG